MFWSRYTFAIVAGAAMAFTINLLYRGLTAVGMSAEATLIDDLLIGVAAAALVFFVQQARDLHRQRRCAAVIEQMNHHIRNALQVIVSRASLDHQDQPELQQINRAVARIDWALREVLPRSANDTAIPSPNP